MKDKLILRAEKILESAGYTVLRYLSACFDLAASGPKQIIVKTLSNVDGVRPEHASELKKFSYCLDVEPLIVGDRTKRSPLRKRVIYERFGIKVLSLDTFKEYVSCSRVFPSYSRGRRVIEFDPGQLKRLREEAGLSLSGMAEEIGVTKEAVYLYEKGVLRMREDIAKGIERKFKVRLARNSDKQFRIPEEKLEKYVSVLFQSFDFEVKEFDRIGFDALAYDNMNRIVVSEDLPRDPEKVRDLSEFFNGFTAFVSEDRELDPPILPKKELEGISSKKELLDLLK